MQDDATKEIARPPSTAFQRVVAFVPSARPKLDLVSAEKATPRETANDPHGIRFTLGPWRIRISTLVAVAGALGVALWGILFAIGWLIF